MLAAPRRTAWIAGLAVMALMLPPAAAAERCTATVFTLPVKMVGQRPVTTVHINGVPVPLVVDTGAFFSFLTEAAAAQLQLPLRRLPFGMRIEGVAGKMEARLTTVKRLEMLGGELANVQFVVGGNEPGGGAMGLLGRNLLAITDAEYDLAHGAIRLIFPKGDCGDTDMAYWAQNEPVVQVPLRRGPRDATPPIRVTTRINGVNIGRVLDTGAPTVLALSAAKRAQVPQEAMKPAGKRHGGGEGELDAWEATIERFELGGEAVSHQRMTVADFAMRSEDAEMLLGIDWFLSHRFYISREQQQMYFTYNGGPIFALNGAPQGEAAASGSPPGDSDAPLAGAEAYALRGAARVARKDLAGARNDLDRACELAPEVADFRVRRAEVLARLDQPAAALKDLDEALRLDPAHLEARTRRAAMRGRAGDNADALDDLQALDRLAAPQAELRFEMARLYSRLERPDLALAQWNLWIAAHANEIRLPDALNARCWDRMLLNQELELALADCNQSLARSAESANVLDSRAWVQLRRGEWRAARADFDAALKIRPQAAWSLYGRGIVRTKQGDAEAGRADLEAARQQLPSIDAEAARHGLAADAPR